MCLILFSYKQHPRYPLVLLANRDEFYDRPTAPASFWEERPDLLAGRDLREGGAWLGMTRRGRLAALTNYRDPASLRSQAPSRGWLVRDYLCCNENAEMYLEQLAPQADRYNGFNLLLGDPFRLFYFSNRQAWLALSPGLYGLSNRVMNTPWPKVDKGRDRLHALLSCCDAPQPEDLFEILRDTARPEDHRLPDTGVGLEWERILSSIFIASPGYGTRSSSLLLVDRERRVTFMERTFHGGAEPRMTVEFQFDIEGDPLNVAT